ncbi:hypothetical protein BT69DRAFT_1289697, partial [Atractiella rhizophila]
NDSFENATSLLGGTFHRMKVMAARQGSHFCYWFAFLLSVTLFFVIVWWWRR